ncbi:ABC transporter permease [Secundilactobacillus paracollinoides]|uniref:ABC transporter permease n=1 Tax=Secundilactobacillus paracollinoides TaxID=240427 RepID=A0A1B2IUM2_9LACO|nr:ABC transporter permease [Secundilactobacillus paracollinoides]ANZ59928.1 ABC transporter permease [Secundilactobacillus paracollinoides]ANZ63114.1 ABC transporter permease [Secundilactobacillus paracollinoides]ANZ65719.1 ABC transporter permease [Secundilactobacillus paracollinoides]
MNFFKRAWLSLLAKKGRSLLMLIVMSAIMLFVFAGLLIHSAADKATQQAKASVGATVTLSANRAAAFKKMQESRSSSSSSRPTLTTSPVKLSDAKKIAKLNNVSSYNATSTTSVNADGFDTVSTSTASSQMGGRGFGSSTSTGDITIDGVTSTASASNFSDGTDKITSGRNLTTADTGTNNTVIESELAKADGLKTGDTIKVKTTSSKKTYTLKIVGIYKAKSSASTSMGFGASDPSNTIYTSYTFANTVKGTKYKNTADSVTFNVSNPSKVSSVKTAGKKLINTSKYSLSTDDASYQSVKASMASVESFANKIVWLVAIAGTIILALIIMLQIRERRHEIGVLLALGESRGKVIGQFFVEMGIVMVVSLVIAGIGGQFIGNKLGNQLVSQQTSSLSTSSSSGTQAPSGMKGTGQAPSGRMGGQMGNRSMMGARSASLKKTNLEVKLSAVQLVKLGAMGLVITLLSVMLAAGNILRLQPKKILLD